MDVDISWGIIWRILLMHFLFDFFFQKQTWKREKSKGVKILSYHCLTYGFGMFMMMPFFSPMWACINMLAHFVVDFFTSRLTSFLWKRDQYNDFFLVIGLDQCLHGVILFGTYIICNNAGSIYTVEQCMEYLGL